MIEITAKKRISLFKSIAVLNLWASQKRPDLAWYIRNFGKWNLSSSEEKNMKDYLEYIDALKNGTITKDGRDLVKTGEIMLPEMGTYQILYSLDVAAGNRIIHFVRIRPADKLEEANLGEFDQFRKLEDKTHSNLLKSNNDVQEFRVEFKRKRDLPPKVLSNGEEFGTVMIKYMNGATRTTLKLESEKSVIELEHSKFDMKQNLKSWVENFDEETETILLSFEEAKKSEQILENFRASRNVEPNSILTPNGRDEGSWSAEIIADVSPISKKDAERWILYLAGEKLSKNPIYMSSENIKSEICDPAIRKSPVSRKFTKFSINARTISEYMREERGNDVYIMMKAAEDLNPGGAEQ